MAYRIKVKNNKGTFLSRKFKTKSDAQQIVKINRQSDTKLNSGGFRRISDGKLIKISNKYRIVRGK